MTASRIRVLAQQAGFELCGVAPAGPIEDFESYSQWVADGHAGAMTYLTGHRAALRADPRNLLPSARAVIVVGKLYNTPHPPDAISRYAWGDNYHLVLRQGLERLAGSLREEYGDFEYRACVDTAPLLERSLARLAGLGWIGKNTCLINQQAGSWFFLGELLVSLPLEPNPAPPPDRCGTCTRCIDACPTSALLPEGGLDARLCISYLTIELRGPVPGELCEGVGGLVFGCDICQDVCPWNRRAAVSLDPAFAPRNAGQPLEQLAALTPEEFRAKFRETPVWRAKYSGFLRNVAIAMGNAGDVRYRSHLERLASSGDATVAEHARSALRQLPSTIEVDG
ncbi:MAG: tRNA epoxyqueuosine(34) reductase QueG [Bryobacteraceae bacterium]|nr:tRNA epoxyqueuosine(34) reductase QueG [Bryobacteraceae bacterium]